MIQLSAEEKRIVAWLEARARVYEEAASKNPFSYHRTRAALCRKLADAIKAGKHR